jgi:hypothetical protein
VPAPRLTASAVSYLYAGEWGPSPEPGSPWTMSVPGGEVDGVATAGNLLNIAIWSLREQGLVALTQLRPATSEPTVILGGRSFAALEAIDEVTDVPGLEGRLLAAARERGDERGVRGLVLALDLHSRHPWETVAEACRQELCDAGVARVEGGVLSRRLVVEPTALGEFRERDGEIVAARQAYRAREGALDDAVAADCAAAVRWAFNSD